MSANILHPRRDIDLGIVSLNPIYADPDNNRDNNSVIMDVGLYTIGNRGRDDLLSFRKYSRKSITPAFLRIYDSVGVCYTSLLRFD